jgi:hypothetical protein
VFVGSGLVRVPLLSSTLVIVATTLVWTPLVFGLSFHAGANVLEMFSPLAVAGIVLAGAAAALAPGAIARLRTRQALVTAPALARLA